MAEPMTLVCWRVDDGGQLLLGSIRGKCLRCESAVWVSVSGQAALANGSAAAVVCVPCAEAGIRPETEVCLVPGAVEEARAHFSSTKPGVA